MKIHTIILAAGEGKRMHSTLPKVLHSIGGLPMLERVVRTAQKIQSKEISVVYGSNGDLVLETLRHLSVNWILQEQQLGTGHALLQTLSVVSVKDFILVLYGDVPLISEDLLQELISAVDVHELGLITTLLNNPKGFGRIVRNMEQEIVAIVEEKDATTEQRNIQEINTGIMLISGQVLHKYLPLLQNNNAQREYYLTDIIALAVQDGKKIASVVARIPEEVFGVNDKCQLASLERYYQKEQAQKLMLQGVTILDPNRFDLRGNVTVGKDVVFDIDIILEDTVVIGDNTKIGANVILRNVKIGNNVIILPNTIIDGAEVEDNCSVGPFARIRPATKLKSKVKIGNFMELKNATIDTNSKASHLSYLGDVTIGKNVNIGAGTITCNYDGINKYHTTIEDGVFIGANSQLVAPITVEKDATIGAGSTITADVPAGKLTVARGRQYTSNTWKRP